ncbi:MAG TPA: hypothetical protein VK618_03465 [Flavitalea sp.]|nr:hypothetical protein [Flavitalea sp.]
MKITLKQSIIISFVALSVLIGCSKNSGTQEPPDQQNPPEFPATPNNDPKRIIAAVLLISEPICCGITSYDTINFSYDNEDRIISQVSDHGRTIVDYHYTNDIITAMDYQTSHGKASVLDSYYYSAAGDTIIWNFHTPNYEFGGMDTASKTYIFRKGLLSETFIKVHPAQSLPFTVQFLNEIDTLGNMIKTTSINQNGADSPQPISSTVDKWDDKFNPFLSDSKFNMICLTVLHSTATGSVHIPTGGKIFGYYSEASITHDEEGYPVKFTRLSNSETFLTLIYNK